MCWHHKMCQYATYPHPNVLPNMPPSRKHKTSAATTNGKAAVPTNLQNGGHTQSVILVFIKSIKILCLDIAPSLASPFLDVYMNSLGIPQIFFFIIGDPRKIGLSEDTVSINLFVCTTCIVKRKLDIKFFHTYLFLRFNQSLRNGCYKIV